MKELNGYQLSRAWFDFCFENQDKVNPTHTAMYLWFIELNNRMGWVEKFASPASQTMAATGVKSYNTYKKIFNDLVGWGFVIEVKKSENQYQACIIALSKFDKSLDKSLDKSVMNHLTNQSEITRQITDSINKPRNNKQLNQETINKKGSAIADVPKEKKVFDFSFIHPEFKEIYMEWLDYRKSIKKSFATQKTLEANYSKLIGLSHHDLELAKGIIENSIANQYTGLFSIKNINYGNNKSNHKPTPSSGGFGKL